MEILNLLLEKSANKLTLKYEIVVLIPYFLPTLELFLK